MVKNAGVVHIEEGAKLVRSALYNSMVKTRSGKGVSEKIIVEKAIQEVKKKFESIKECMAAAMTKCQKYKKVVLNPGKYSKATIDKRKADKVAIKLQKAADKRSKRYNFLTSLKNERGTFSKVAKNPGLKGYYSKASKAARKAKWDAGAADRATRKANKAAATAEMNAIKQAQKDHKETMKAAGIKAPRKKKDSLQNAIMAALED